jgi:hypothetical protein
MFFKEGFSEGTVNFDVVQRAARVRYGETRHTSLFFLLAHNPLRVKVNGQTDTPRLRLLRCPCQCAGLYERSCTVQLVPQTYAGT